MQKPEIWLPLRVLYCDQCWLVQTQDFAAADSLFTSDYAYFSSMSASWLDHAARYAEQMTARFRLGKDSMVVEIASNDGYLLKNFQTASIPCLGIEPTAAVATEARNLGIETREIFFGVETAQKLAAEGISAKLMAANNVLAHVPDINDFVGGFKILLAADGVATFEFPHLLNLVRLNQFDTIYHEHFSYLSLLSVARIMQHQGLEVFDVERLPTHGGSLRVFVQHAGGPQQASDAVQALLDEETGAGMDRPAFYEGFHFVTGTLILTATGERPVETLEAGDLVVTRDNGLQPLRWVGRKEIAAGADMQIDFRPVCIPAHSFGAGKPAQDLYVSPRHRIMVADYHCNLLFGTPEVLTAAKHLTGSKAFLSDRTCGFAYFHLLFDQHQIVYSNGLPTESFHPGHVGLDAFDAPVREELFALYPDLRVAPNTYDNIVRMEIRRFEATLLFQAS